MIGDQEKGISLPGEGIVNGFERWMMGNRVSLLLLNIKGILSDVIRLESKFKGVQYHIIQPPICKELLQFSQQWPSINLFVVDVHDNGQERLGSTTVARNL